MRTVAKFGPWENRQLVGRAWGTGLLLVPFDSLWLGTFPEDFRGERLCAV